jgi:hypothetical protein
MKSVTAKLLKKLEKQETFNDYYMNWFVDKDFDLECVKRIECSDENVWFISNIKENHVSKKDIFFLFDQNNNFIKLNTKPDF